MNKIKQCLNCGRNVLSTTRKIKRFCSRKCSGSFYNKTHRILKGIGSRGGKYYKCDYCGKDVWVRPCYQKFKTHFCNFEHHLLYQKRNAFSKKCIVCGNIFFCQPCQIKYRNRKTCSRKCSDKLKNEIAKKNRIKNGFTKHQIDRCLRYSAEANEWRKKVFEMDNYTCLRCNKRGGRLEAHHIKPFAYYPELRYELSNGETLCRRCHDKTKKPYNVMRNMYSQSIRTGKGSKDRSVLAGDRN